MRTIYVPTANGYETLNATDALSKNRCIWINGQVDGNMAIDVISALLHYDKESEEEIILFIHSPGGNIQEGLAIYDVMKTIHAPVRTIAVGIAASMGAVLLAAGTQGRRMVMPSAKVMIHQPLIAGMGPANVSDIIELGESMKSVKQMMNQILADCTNHTSEEIDDACKMDHYFSAEEAVAYGLADCVVSKENGCF